MFHRFVFANLFAVLLAGSWLCGSDASAVEGRWKRIISYQSKNDLFANYQVGPNPSGAAAAMYVSPRPVPARVGHTYTTYQPLMPHEFMYNTRGRITPIRREPDGRVQKFATAPMACGCRIFSITSAVITRILSKS